ncbi:MAG: hypothetical protein BGP06_05225 [Rhizobiales bacterium 65-9]|nr:hypothetical protein [Hyphomicrobiales bacterium]OJY35292.1 MAG: hypothetical protein BGP06_05225 [Rhizobiales bacterium 65-9]
MADGVDFRLKPSSQFPVSRHPRRQADERGIVDAAYLVEDSIVLLDVDETMLAFSDANLDLTLARRFQTGIRGRLRCSALFVLDPGDIGFHAREQLELPLGAAGITPSAASCSTRFRLKPRAPASSAAETSVLASGQLIQRPPKGREAGIRKAEKCANLGRLSAAPPEVRNTVPFLLSECDFRPHGVETTIVFIRQLLHSLARWRAPIRPLLAAAPSV